MGPRRVTRERRLPALAALWSAKTSHCAILFPAHKIASPAEFRERGGSMKLRDGDCVRPNLLKESCHVSPICIFQAGSRRSKSVVGAIQQPRESQPLSAGANSRRNPPRCSACRPAGRTNCVRSARLRSCSSRRRKEFRRPRIAFLHRRTHRRANAGVGLNSTAARITHGTTPTRSVRSVSEAGTIIYPHLRIGLVFRTLSRIAWPDRHATSASRAGRFGRTNSRQFGQTSPLAETLAKIAVLRLAALRPASIGR
jgi:hypothetical protein